MAAQHLFIIRMATNRVRSEAIYSLMSKGRLGTAKSEIKT